MTSKQEPASERPYSRKEVVQIVQSVMASVGSETEATRRMQRELQLLHDYIENTRAELAQMRSIEISHSHIPAATDELDAVVDETAKATGAIMDACEKIEALAGKIGGAAGGEFTSIVTTVYEACSFQDITGQRITKVVKTLKNIEIKVADILSAFGHGLSGGAAASQGKAPLVSGPQLKGPAISQDEIDKLLAEFDKK